MERMRRFQQARQLAGRCTQRARRGRGTAPRPGSQHGRPELEAALENRLENELMKERRKERMSLRVAVRSGREKAEGSCQCRPGAPPPTASFGPSPGSFPSFSEEIWVHWIRKGLGCEIFWPSLFRERSCARFAQRAGRARTSPAHRLLTLSASIRPSSSR